MQLYESYKPSGLDWLGDIPSGWSLLRAKYVFREIDDRSVSGDEELLSVSHLTGVTPRSEKNVTMFMSEDYSGAKLCHTGDVVINTMWAWMGALGVSPTTGIVSPAYGVYRQSSNKLLPNYADWLLRTPQYIAEYTRRSTGVNSSRLRLYPDRFLDMPILIPPIEDQHRIVFFLEQKAAEIDAAIAKKERLIELLSDQKKILLQRAVTRGLTEGVPMRNSGVAWIGEIPSHWSIKRVRAAFKNLDSCRIPLSGEQRGKMTSRIYDYYGASGAIDKVDDYLFDEPLILIAEDGANLVMRNLRLAFIASGKYWVNNHAHILRPFAGNIRYLCEALECVDYNPLITGAAQPKLTKDALKGVEIPFPSPEEQDAIASFISGEEEKYNEIEGRLRNEITLLAALKKTTIANAVTGKIKV